MAWNIDTVATELLACELERRDRVKFTDEWPELDVETGYKIQDETLSRRLARGETLVGVKLGLTSRAKQERMGVATPFVAWLTDAMALPADLPVPQNKLIHPRVEPELVFIMGERLEGPGVTGAQALAAVSHVLAGAEVIDSRYRDFKFLAGDVVADIGAGSGYFALRFAPLLPQGRVLAVDVSQPMLDEVGRRATAAGMRNLVPVLGGFDDPRLPAGGVDVIFTCNTWHHIDGRDAYLARVKAALTPGGRVAVVDFHKESPRGPANMKLARAAVVDEFQRNGFRLAAEHTFLPDQYLSLIHI